MEQKTNEGWEKRYSNLLTPGTRIMAPTAQEAMSTHNTREGIEEIVNKIGLATYGGVSFKANPEYIEKIGNILHQELQKAREEERERILLAIARIGKIDFRLSDVLDAINQSDKKCIMKKIEEYNEVMTQEELQALTQPNNK